ncbi:hypothetical protein CROQUDRAFT_652359 [Cronartium quercuum f. sp. fusiforme G11]|uniref:Uncharacterized protein n=1 Tax=Cronartium quercuum f. sp. fusiforme G11 TaxID=708437 RepID=A0A9P6NNK4_9BASI|nr:hypothetical protein CROQUDRAFT_652359 [Cronartium quercuum f. sp. fusiforme G11]
MSPNWNASTSKTLINQAINISHPYLQAQAQPTIKPLEVDFSQSIFFHQLKP